MRILVAGGGGFVGSHLVQNLLEQGNDVVSASRSGTRFEPVAPAGNVPGTLTNLHWDISEPLHLEVDAIYNLASPASPHQHLSDPFSTIRANVHGTWNLLELATSRGIPMFQASTSEIYGEAMESPQKETYFGNVNPVDKRASYTESKRLAETLCSEFRRTRGTDVRIGRIFSAYGPGMHLQGGRAVSNFVTQALRNETIRIFGDGSQVRSFTYISDLVEGIELIMSCREPLWGPVNIGDPAPTTLLGLAELVIQATQSKSRVELVTQENSSTLAIIPDISLARASLGWEPKVPIELGIGLTIEDFKRRMSSKFDA